MKVIVTFSSGKDSLAALIWTLENMTKDPVVVFCDTGWEHPLTYDYINYVSNRLDIEIKTVRSKKYDGLVDLSRKKKRFPSSQRRFCTSELKSIPMIDFILDEVKDDIIVVQGIRHEESAARALMNRQCNYFKYYAEPYGYDKNGKPKYHTYRRKDVLKYIKKHATDVLRPVISWTAREVIDYAVSHGVDPNPLYKMGMVRVGCFPCIMARQAEIFQISIREPERINEIAGYEKSIGSSFFGPDKIPSRFYKGNYPLIQDVVAYVQDKNATGSLFDDEFSPTSCMSYYGLCE